MLVYVCVKEKRGWCCQVKRPPMSGGDGVVGARKVTDSKTAPHCDSDRVQVSPS